MSTSGKTIQARLLSSAVKLLLYVLQHARFLINTDLSVIMTNATEKLLNLPGKLPFFPTKTTDTELVRDLLTKLHPVVCSRELIRFGPDGDGGYLVPNDLEGIEACFSPGVSDIAGFEMDCAERGMKIFMADGSVDEPPMAHAQFRFIQKFIGADTQGNFLSLEEWVNNETGGSQSDLLLQMDIEGYEYETLISAPTSLLRRFRIIIIEFHNLECLFSEQMFSIYRHAFERILRNHACVHIHPNNYCGTIRVGDLELPQIAEFTFLRNDRISNQIFATKFPHSLDRDNTGKMSYSLPRSCYRVQ
jgi:Methyltransferase FkbM domain